MPKETSPKRTRVCPPYRSMYENAKSEVARLRIELSHIDAKLALEYEYSGKLSEALKKKGGE